MYLICSRFTQLIQTFLFKARTITKRGVRFYVPSVKLESLFCPESRIMLQRKHGVELRSVVCFNV